MSESARSLEVERKFRVLVATTQLSDVWEPLAAWEIWQGYLTVPGAPVEVRVRRMLQLKLERRDDFYPEPDRDQAGRHTVRHVLTIKRELGDLGAAGMSRHESEIPVSDEFFNQAWAACERRRLRKVRVEYMAEFPGSGPRVVAVDTFRDRLEGLVLAELEFDTWQEARDFSATDTLGEEVTRDRRFRNGALASSSAPPDLL